MCSLLELPNRGVLPATGAFGVCTKLPTYVALHSTTPDQDITTDPTNPLVRKLQKQQAQLNSTKTPGKGSSSGRKRKCAAPEAHPSADNTERRSSVPAPAVNAHDTDRAGAVDFTQKTFSSTQLSRMLKKELQQILKAYGATVSGKKQELAERVTQAQSRRKDRVIVISDGEDQAPAPRGLSATAEQEREMTDADVDEDEDQPMYEAQHHSEPEANADGFTRESI